MFIVADLVSLNEEIDKYVQIQYINNRTYQTAIDPRRYLVVECDRRVDDFFRVGCEKLLESCVSFYHI